MSGAPSAETVTADQALEFIVMECRDLIEFLIEEDVIPSTPGSRPLDSAARNELVRKHLSTDLSNYGIAVWEYIGLDEDEAKAVIDAVLARGEYNED